MPVPRKRAMTRDLAPALQALSPLLGSWAGRGAGKYPTIRPFEYLEEVVFAHVGKPFLTYTQQTRAVADGKPLHSETGISAFADRAALNSFSPIQAASPKLRLEPIR